MFFKHISEPRAKNPQIIHLTLKAENDEFVIVENKVGKIPESWNSKGI